VLEWGLGAGETAVLAVALVRAKKQGRIASAAVVMQDLRMAGLSVDEALVTTVLRDSVGEAWPPSPASR
jgi:hypothetical protein